MPSVASCNPSRVTTYTKPMPTFTQRIRNGLPTYSNGAYNTVKVVRNPAWGGAKVLEAVNPGSIGAAGFGQVLVREAKPINNYLRNTREAIDDCR